MCPAVIHMEIMEIKSHQNLGFSARHGTGEQHGHMKKKSLPFHHPGKSLHAWDHSTAITAQSTSARAPWRLSHNIASLAQSFVPGSDSLGARREPSPFAVDLQLLALNRAGFFSPPTLDSGSLFCMWKRPPYLDRRGRLSESPFPAVLNYYSHTSSASLTSGG